MSSEGWAWCALLQLGNGPAKGVLGYMANRAYDSNSKIFQQELAEYRHLVQSHIGIYLSGMNTLVQDSNHSLGTVKTSVKAMQAVGLIWPGDPRIAEAHSRAKNRVPRGFELNHVIRHGKSSAWLAAAFTEALLWGTSAGRKKSQYGSLTEAMQKLVPLADLGFEWVEPMEGTAGHWRPAGNDPSSRPVRGESEQPSAERRKATKEKLSKTSGQSAAAPSSNSSPKSPSGATAPNPWVNEDTAVQEPAASLYEVDPDAERTPEGLEQLPKQPPPGQAQTEWRRENYRWEQTKERPPKPPKQKPLNSEASWKIMDWWWQQQERPPVGKDNGARFARLNQDQAQALLNEKFTCEQVMDAMTKLGRGMPQLDQLRDVASGAWNGKPRGGPGGSRSMDSARETSQLAGMQWEETDEQRSRRARALQAMHEDEDAAGEGQA